MATTISAQSLIEQYNRGPISAVFTPPSSCLSTYTSVPGTGGLYFGHGGGQLYWDPSCYPTATTTSTVANTDALWNLYYYSPAVSCPIGWATAGTAKDTFGGVRSIYLTISSDTTVVLCCPSGFTSISFQHQCGSSFPAGQNTIPYKAPSMNANGNWDIPNALSTTYRTITGPGDWTVFGDGIPIWYQESDKVSFTASKTTSARSSPTTTSLPSLPTTISTSSIPSVSSVSPTNSPQTPSRLTTGAKAGIGVGVALGVLGLAAIIAFFLFKRRQRASANYITAPKHELSGQNPQIAHELPDGVGEQSNMHNYKYSRAELDN